MIRTERLVLRRATLGDVEAIHVVLSEPRAMTYWAHPPHERLEQTQTWLADMMAGTPEQSEDFLIEQDGRVIGKIGAWRLPEFGYLLHPDYWGQGLASEAMAAFLKRIAERGDIDRLRADIDPRNHASIRLLERFGFHESGRAARTYNTHIGWCDSVYFELDRAGIARWA